MSRALARSTCWLASGGFFDPLAGDWLAARVENKRRSTPGGRVFSGPGVQTLDPRISGVFGIDLRALKCVSCVFGELFVMLFRLPGGYWLVIDGRW